MMMTRVLAFAARAAALGGLLPVLDRADRWRPNLLRVLTYHRVARRADWPAVPSALISATPETFEQQLTWLADRYHVVSLQEVLHAQRTRAALPPRSVLITFDDGYRDFAELAWPILKRHRLPVTMFVPTGFPDQPERRFWWDRLHEAVQRATQAQVDTPLGRLALTSATQRRPVLARLTRFVRCNAHDHAMAWIDRICTQLGSPWPDHGVLTWSELRRLSSEGVTLAAHTRTHPLLNRVSPARARAEVIESVEDLEREVGPVPPVFAYPGGAFNEEVVTMLRREGFSLAFTTGQGINDMRIADPLRLRRINVGHNTTRELLWTRLLSWSLHFNRWRPLPDC